MRGHEPRLSVAPQTNGQFFNRDRLGTSTEDSPWFVVPADDKDSARLIVSRIVLDAFAKLKMSYPVVTPERKRELRAIRKALGN